MAEFDALDSKITQLNLRLKMARLGVQIERRGTKLNLRGTLPPRPGCGRLRPYQQRLSLGLPATPAGLKQIEQEAKIIAAQLIQKSFDWRDYLTIEAGKRLSQLDLVEQIQAFERQFFAASDRVSKPAATKTTWNAAYAPYLRKLAGMAQDHPKLTLPELIYKTVHSTAIQSRSRQVCCTALSAFAEFLNLELPTELKTLAGSYNNSRTQARNLPSDEAIVQAWAQIPNPAWQFVYGIMATFGLRNHEVFFCDYTQLQQGETSIQVLDTTKTGSHEVWAFYPEWIEEFHLRSIQLPEINTDLSQTTLQRVGQRVTAQFRRYGVPFSPYDLRHAWAVRTIHFGLPDTVAAKMMGHSVAVHTRTYHQWITRRDQQAAVEAAIAKNSRSAPTLSTS
ncbi:site-specific integrase [Alkalinema sp. FACHB-956]|uniref:site-specific integrase n=1 Tax=Alkalinema sp. FACHB-956 TaxID=2692768 RepID=UPI0016849C85|nr:site-specific integrase [Alkalinema sp. FACHB-956]MBD2326958.1 site-specific integrase [Alkalinema sp. FACHB-956]